MTTQSPVLTQRIWGAFSPTTNQIVGVQTSGEGVYQNIPNQLLGLTYAAVRTATSAATQSVQVMGHNSVSDGQGGSFAYNPADTTSGCVCIGSSAGTVLTVNSVMSGTVAVGLTLCSSVTGLPLATIVSNGTGSGGAGTYNLSTTVNQGGPFTFLIDNNSSILVSADGSRWYLSTLNALISGLTAPSGNPALAVTTPLYSFGNTTDNPNFTFLGTGLMTVPRLTVASGNFTSRGIADTATATVLEVSGAGATAQLQGYGPNAATFVDMTPDTGAFTGTLTGFSPAAPTVGCVWSRYGKIVVLTINSTFATATGTSNATSFGMSALPPPISPPSGTNWYVATGGFFEDNGAGTSGQVAVNGSNVIFFKGIAITSTSWTGAGTKGLLGPLTIMYTLI